MLDHNGHWFGHQLEVLYPHDKKKKILFKFLEKYSENAVKTEFFSFFG